MSFPKKFSKWSLMNAMITSGLARSRCARAASNPASSSRLCSSGTASGKLMSPGACDIASALTISPMRIPLRCIQYVVCYLDSLQTGPSEDGGSIDPGSTRLHRPDGRGLRDVLLVLRALHGPPRQIEDDRRNHTAENPAQIHASEGACKGSYEKRCVDEHAPDE